MCEPTTIAMASLSAIQSASAISDQNKASAANRVNANDAMNDEIEQSGKQYIEQNRSLIQGGFDAVLQGRADEATSYTSAIENGVQGASVKALMRSQKQITDRNAGRTRQEMTSLSDQQGANFKHIAAKAQGRINSAPTTGWTIGDTASVLAPIVKAEME